MQFHLLVLLASFCLPFALSAKLAEVGRAGSVSRRRSGKCSRYSVSRLFLRPGSTPVDAWPTETAQWRAKTLLRRAPRLQTCSVPLGESVCTAGGLNPALFLVLCSCSSVSLAEPPLHYSTRRFGRTLSRRREAAVRVPGEALETFLLLHSPVLGFRTERYVEVEGSPRPRTWGARVRKGQRKARRQE